MEKIIYNSTTHSRINQNDAPDGVGATLNVKNVLYYYTVNVLMRK
jgi:hypothetical protein